MSNISKVEIKIGNVSFSGEGDQEWLAEQLDKVLQKLSGNEITFSSKEIKEDGSSNDDSNSNNASSNNVNLSIFLRDNNATSNQRRKFLATSVWLAHNNENNLQTSDITKALKDSHQNKLSNAADCLNKNVSQGYCEKDGDHFYVTQQGFDQFKDQ